MATGLRQWLSGHKSLAATLASGIVVTALVVTTTITSGGYSAQRLDLNDASVWVTNASSEYVGRVNADVLQLDTVVPVDGAQTDIVQSGSTVIAVDRADARADIIDPATAQVTKTVPLPPEQPSVYLAGTTLAVYSQGTGELWVMPTEAFPTFESEQAATLNLGAGSIVSVDDAGVLYAYSPDVAKIRRVDLASGGSTASTSASTFEQTATSQFSVTSVGRHWAVLDATTARIEVDGTIVDLSPFVGTDGNPVLQAASSTGNGVLVAWSGGVLIVPFGRDSPDVLASAHSGAAAAPLVSDGCVFAAWTDGTAIRNCAPGSGGDTVLRLTDVQAGARLAFQHNDDRVLLNDRSAGSSWAVQRDAQLIDNWSDLIEDDQQQTDVRPNDDASETVVEKDQSPPIAVDDDLGARPGRSTTLSVLLNDYDPNGDVLVVDSINGLDAAAATVDLINERQQLQLTLPANASGSIEFDYTISDGRGGSATAHVTVRVRDADENSPPSQVRTTRSTVEAGGQGSFAVLGDWVDPDGDPFYLTSASVQQPDLASFGPDGTVVVSAAPASIGRIAVALVVSDGTDEGTGSATVTVRTAGKVPIVADPFVVLASTGEEITINPLAHVRGGAGPVTLNAVPPRSGSTLTPSYEAGTFRFESDQVRTHYIDYVVTDGISTVTGTVRVEVSAPPDVNSTPITVPKTVFVRTLGSATVNVAASDIDPAGGVLLVIGTTPLPTDSNIDVAVLNQESVRVTLTGALDGAVTFEYTVTNGLAEATGTITVIEIPSPTLVQPPIARDDTATARVGDAIVIDVLANDEQPDGLEITLDQKLVDGLSGDSGLLFASGSTLRYLAPDRPGNFTAVYQVTGSNGQTAQAQVRIEVREPNSETNSPPVPTTLSARVLAGQSVRVEIPLTGIDPDGDSVQFLGQETNPEKGAVTETGTSYIVYTAGDYSAGTDAFTYTVIDALGARATGTVRIGIAPRPAGARNPVATPDTVDARPNTAVSVQVLANDADPDGGALTVIGAVPTDETTTAVIESASIVTVTPPANAPDGSTYSVLYTIQNSLGGTSQAFVTVVISATAPLSYPVATDTVLTLSDIRGRTSVDVDVLSNVFFADGDNGTLGLSVLAGYGEPATITADKKIRITVGSAGQIIPFSVSHPQDSSIKAYAFIWVPGLDDAVPQLVRSAPALTVNSEQALTIDLNTYVVAAADRQIRITDSSTVQATHANGDPLVVNDHTLRYTSADNYSGPASVSFEVTDGSSATDPNGRKATLVLSISVTQRTNAPPVFTGAVLEFEPGEQKEIDLVRLTNYPHPDDIQQLSYSAVAPLPTGFQYEVRGSTLTIRADEGAVVGSTTGITMAVRDSVAQGQPGRISLSVVSSTRPLVRPAPDVALAQRGETTVIDVLANDESTNPFPDEPLRVVSISGANGGALPDGVTVTASDDDSKLTVRVADDANPADANLQYRVADATNDPKRYASGTVRISVQDVPDAPAAPQRQADQLVGGELRLRLTPPQQNNSAITGYTVVSSSHGNYSQDCELTLICSLSGLIVGAEYRFSVIATNDIGASEPSPLSDVYTVDYKPAAPTTVTATPAAASDAPEGKAITVSWPSVPEPDPGSPIIGYTVVVTGAGVAYTAKDVTSPFTTLAGGALANDASYTVTVYARNSAQVLSETEWRRATTTVRTVGPPSVPSSGPAASLIGTTGQVRVTWGDSSPNGAGAVQYSVGRVDGNADAPTCTSGSTSATVLAGAAGVSSGWVDTTAQDGRVYTYIVYTDNGIYCTAAASGPIESKQVPGQATGTVSLAYRDSGQWDVRVNADLAASGTVARFEYRLDAAGAWQPVVPGQYLTSSGDASRYGNPTTVTFRACRDASYDYCGAPSAGSTVTPYNVRASVTTCVPGVPPTIAAPVSGGTVPMSYSLSYEIQDITVLPEPDPDNPVPIDTPPPTYTWSDFSYRASDPVPVGARTVRIRSTVTGTDFVDSGYGEGTCG